MTNEVKELVKMGFIIIPLCSGDHKGMTPSHIKGCQSPGKRPLISKWTDITSITIEQFEKWNKQFPTANWGLVLGQTDSYNLVGIDIDGEEGERYWNELTKDKPLPATVEFATGAGRRVLYQLPFGLQTKKQKITLDGKHSEVAFCCQGQQTVIPPSIHNSGRVYEWIPGKSPFDIDIAHAPQWIVDLVSGENLNSSNNKVGRPSKESKLRKILNTDFSKVGEGARNETLFNYIINIAEHRANTTDRSILLLIANTANKEMDKPLCDEEVEKIVDSAINTILAKTSGISYPFKDDNNKPLKIYENLIPILEKNNIYPAYNQISNEVEILGVEAETLTSQVEDVYSLAQKHNFNITDKQCGRFLTRISLNNMYNPVVDYLEDLYSKNPGVTGAIDKLCEAIISPTDINHSLKKLLITKWLVATVDIAFNDGTKNLNGILIFQGPQGIGKTRFIKWLVPKDLNKYLKTDISLDPSNPDHKILISRYWIVELGELGVTTKKDTDILKAFITSNIDEVRKPYAAAADKMPRTTSLFGTVNELEFLRDETGSRRFWVVPVEKIDWDILNDINVDDIWSEAMRLRDEGLKTYLDNEELKLLNENNQDYQVITTVEMRIQAYFDWSKDINYWTLYTGAEIQDLLELSNNRGLLEKFKKIDNRVSKKKSMGVFKYLLPPRKYL